MAKRSISMPEQTRYGDSIMDSEVREVPSRFVDFRTFLKEQVPLKKRPVHGAPALVKLTSLRHQADNSPPDARFYQPTPRPTPPELSPPPATAAPKVRFARGDSCLE